MKQVSTILLVNDPPIARLAALIEYMRAVSDEFIFVVDSRADPLRTSVIASWPGVTIVPFEWTDDFATARNAALPFVTRPWTLTVDPDELPSVGMMAHILSVTAEGADEKPIAYIYWTPNWWGGVKGVDEPCHWHIRLWRSGRGAYYRPVHELVRLDGKDEPQTRGNIAVHAPGYAYLIHSKSADLMAEADALYGRLAAE
jgi:hypothetical protein